MKRLQAWKYELRPNGLQKRLMRRFAGCCRVVFNKALALQEEHRKNKEKMPGYAALCKLLTAWRHDPETQWLAEAPAQALQQALKDLERAWTNRFAGRAKLPRFKKRGQGDSFRYPDAKQIHLDEPNSRIFLPKLGWLRYRKSREIQGRIKNVTVSLSCDKWFISIQTERDLPEPVHPCGPETAVGIDLGIARFATFSDGSFLAPLSSFKQHEKALRKAQQRLSRKVKFSKNWRKAKARVQRLHARIARVRRDFLHKATSLISKNHAWVFVEDLQVRNMSKSAKGTPEKPGKRVKAKSGLNRAILDQGWYEFRRQLQYKLDWLGGKLFAVPPQYTSQICPKCGQVNKENRKTQAKFACVQCGFQENADVVGALNILRAGLARIACEVSGAVMPPAAGTRRSDSGVLSCS